MALRAISDLDVLLACEGARQRRVNRAPRPYVDMILRERTGHAREERQRAIQNAHERRLIGRVLAEEIWIEERGAMLLLDHLRQLPTYDDFAHAALGYLCELARTQACPRLEAFMAEAERRNVSV